MARAISGVTPTPAFVTRFLWEFFGQSLRGLGSAFSKSLRSFAIDRSFSDRYGCAVLMAVPRPAVGPLLPVGGSFSKVHGDSDDEGTVLCHGTLAPD